MTAIARVDAARVLEVAGLLAPHIRHTPMIPTPSGGFLKLESLQPTGSFKVRGFFAAAHVVDRERVARGLLTVSAGNAALACAYVARELRVPCRVVMFDTAPALKVNGVRALGASTVLMPRDRLFEWIAARAWEQDPEVFIHPFADDSVIIGHASIVPEILSDLPDVERVLVPVGGGGLICGIALGFAALKPDVQVVGVQSDGYPLWQRAFAVHGPPSLTPNTIADGTSAPFDPVMFERLGALVRAWALVPEAVVRSTVARLATEVKVVAEGAGALAYAAMLEGRSTPRTVAILSGGNIDGSLLARLLTE
ncbi:MAG TPA: pyridoxal-phosphate dependent enzyme [Candidatus Saccharimonadales bacterium]|nr:pyridoxal-phosphate dependent enzyme [Candidatus Saccharimonadales bacterium]